VSEHVSSLLPLRFLRLFLETLSAEIGRDVLAVILEKADLPADLLNPQAVSRYKGQSAAETYARIQKAMRAYYGRGARSMLLRVGRLLWGRLLQAASIPEKTTAQFIRTLPAAMRGKAALELLARFMGEKTGSVTVQTVDSNLLLADHISAACLGQAEASPVCHVTLGLIQESLFWATARDHDVAEVACRAAGGNNCEFKITVAGT